MRIKFLLFLAQLMAFSLVANVRFQQSDTSIDRFDFVEITLTVSNRPAGNPFLETEVTGEFAREGETPVRVEGFCDSDDGSVFRIRFMATRAGKHTYSVTYKRAGDEQRHTGTFTARAGRRKGMVRVGEKRVWPARIAESRVRLAWEMTMAGGYQSTGERANIAGMGGWITGRGNDRMTMLEGYARMRAFFEKFEWWKLEPHPELVTGESKALPVAEKGPPMAAALCLAEPDKRYVIYLRQGGTAKLQLAEGRYAVERFDPQTAKSQALAPVVGGASWTTPAVPDTDPWVFLVERK